MRKVFLEELSVYTNGRYKNKINWEKSIGRRVRFIYDNIEGEVEIVEYEKREQCLYIKYNDKTSYKIHTSSFLKCNFGMLLEKVTSEFKVTINTIFKDKNRDLVVIDKEYRNREDSNGKDKWYKYKCNKCGWEEGWIIESALLKGTGCSCCASSTVVQGINDIPTTAPWMVKYFQGGYDEAKLYTQASHQKIYTICPDCGKVKDKKISISQIYINKNIACNCGDRISYPEKVMYSFLEQLHIDFKVQLSNQDFKWCKKYKYDFYFTANNKQYIIETHGLQHYEERHRGRTLEEEQKNDKIKEQLAKENGIDNYIVIDCRRSELEFIKNNIINSRLSELFDLSKVNWLKCEECSCKNLVKEVCALWESGVHNTTEIGKIQRIDRHTVVRYLKLGVKFGWTNYDPKVASINKYEKMSKSIEVFKNGYSLGKFNSTMDIERNSMELFGVKILHSNVSSVCKGKIKQCNGYVFKYA